MAKILKVENMPEGPSIILVKEAVTQFIGKKIIAVSGNSKIDQSKLLNKKIVETKSWGKHFLICLDGLTLRVHFLMFGNYTKQSAITKLGTLNSFFKRVYVNHVMFPNYYVTPWLISSCTFAL